MISRTAYSKNPRLEGADWPMVVHLLKARGHYPSMSAIGKAAGFSCNPVRLVLEGEVEPRRVFAYWLYNAAHRHFSEADKELASLSPDAPQWLSDYHQARRGIAA